MIRRTLLAVPLAASALVLAAPHAWAGSWQSFSVSEIDGSTTVAKASGSFYSSTGDNEVEFRGTLYAREGNCAHVEFYSQTPDTSLNPFDLDGITWIKVAENRRYCNTASTDSTREFDTTRNKVWSGAKKVKVKICQEQTGPDDCESHDYWMTS
jgi:hypothetical protein